MLPRGVAVRVVEGDLLQVALDGRGAIVNPANAHGVMGGGVAGAIRRAGGPAIEEEARKRSPIALGAALLTTAGTLAFHGVIHAPTMVHPGGDADAQAVREACRAAVKLAHAERLDSLAFPGMGTGTGGLEPTKAARAMLRGIAEGLRDAGAPPPTAVVLVAYDDRLRAAFEEALRLEEVPSAGAPP
ncbi:MAG TPA: macro domain-containing protein [Candidatus Thermoplasmatota archaeon]|jgi:O-acetyl-ADP-ribose deacetylase (regulator of RNase III)|nr:macro domain-containing protein [Candidatus Thermoplasmatota archaeon]